MNPIIKNLIHKIEVKKTQAHLTNLKTNTTNYMPAPFMLNRESQVKIASLEAENARLKASVSPNIIAVQNSAGDYVIPVTARDSSGKLATKNLSMDQAALHSKRMVAKFTSKPSKAPRASATAPAPAPTPLPASREVTFEPTPTLKPLTRSEFNAMSPHDRTRFAVAGGKLK